MLATPITYIFFNRPEITRRTFALTRAQKPRQLYLIADGPRSNHATDALRCRQAREIVEEMIDWECEVTRDFSNTNLGAGRRISSGLTAAFAKLGETIVLEDDILPHPDFFPFCETMLARYRERREVHGISGYNPVGRYLPAEKRAFHSLTHHTWGWASWQRAWADYRGAFEGWEDERIRGAIRDYLRNDLYFFELARAIEAVERREVDAWDYQWLFTMLYEKRHCVMSAVNLCGNLGFSDEATHTYQQPAFFAGLRSYPLPCSPLPDLDSAPDRLFDRVHWQIYLTGSRLKIALLRFLASRHRALLSFALRYRTAQTSCAPLTH